MRLVLRLLQHELHGAEDGTALLGHEQQPLAAFQRGRDATPEGACANGVDRQHEADRGTPFDAVDQQRRQRVELRGRDLREPSDGELG